MRMHLFISIIVMTFLLSCKTDRKVTNGASDKSDGSKSKQQFLPGKVWNDTDGNPINAHGGGIIYVKDAYYWFGEYKKGETWQPESTLDWEGTRVEATGIACYSSKDLYNWRYEGIVLKANNSDSTHDLHTSKVMERPKVIYNEKTENYVMWFHCDSQDYSYSRAGVAVSENVTGPYKFIGSLRPNNSMSRDQTVFKDTDGKAYHIYSSENNETMHVSLLCDDYLKPSGNYNRIFVGRTREAPAIFKRKNEYYLISSGCTGWKPNPAEYAVTNEIMGEWKVLGDPCDGDTNGTTFDSQSTFVLQVEQKQDTYILMADRWNHHDLEKSSYVWLPIKFENEIIKINWLDDWAINN